MANNDDEVSYAGALVGVGLGLVGGAAAATGIGLPIAAAAVAAGVAGGVGAQQGADKGVKGLIWPIISVFSGGSGGN